MGASVFSFLMSLFWCSIFLVIAVIWNKTMMLKHGTGYALFAIAIGIGRLILPLDLPISVIIRSTSVMPAAQRYLEVPAFDIENTTVTRFNILLVVWMIGSIIYLLCIAASLLRQRHWISKMKLKPAPNAEEILKKIVSESKPGKEFYIFEADEIESPILTGYFTPIILFPTITLSAQDTKYVLLHEWNHFLHKHLWIKLLFNIFCALLWWNPLVYMAKSNLDYILEVNCDSYVIRGLNQDQRTEYVSALAEVIRQLKNLTVQKPKGTIGFVGIVSSKIVQRCKLILFPPKQFKRVSKYFVASVLIGLSIFSYAFIFQSLIPPPVEESAKKITVDIDPENSYLVANDNGTFTLYLYNTASDIISKGNVKKTPYASLKIYK